MVENQIILCCCPYGDIFKRSKIKLVLVVYKVKFKLSPGKIKVYFKDNQAEKIHNFVSIHNFVFTYDNHDFEWRFSFTTIGIISEFINSSLTKKIKLTIFGIFLTDWIIARHPTVDFFYFSYLHLVNHICQ